MTSLTTLEVVPLNLPKQSNDCVYAIPPNLSTSQYLRLWTAYINSGLHPRTFLARINYPNPDNKQLQRRLSYDLREHLDAFPVERTVPRILLDTARASPETISHFDLTLEQILDPGIEWATSIAVPAVVTQSIATRIDPDLSPSEQIALMRRNLVHEDWGCAQALAQKTLAYLDALEPGDIRPADLRAIAATFLDIQKIKRMALGMSSENVGFKVEGQDAEGNDLPIINVMQAVAVEVVEANVEAN